MWDLFSKKRYYNNMKANSFQVEMVGMERGSININIPGS